MDKEIMTEAAAGPDSEQEEKNRDLDELRKKEKKAEKKIKAYQTFIIRLILILIVIWALFFKILGLTHMPSGDMYPRIDGGDMLLFYRLDTDVKSQDVIVIEKETPLSNGEKKVFVLRVVAVGGDTVDIDKSGALIVNGRTLAEQNIFYRMTAYEGYTEFPLKLADDECFVLADARTEGSDSRYFGPVKQSEIQGTVITILRRNNL